MVDVELLKCMLKEYDFMVGDGYVELMVQSVMPLLAPDERTRHYALEVLFLLTGRSEFKRAL